jgi:hypothetical protein
MVARINTGKNISKALNYNEQKVQQGKAEIIAAVGFVKEVEQMNFYDKMSQFERHISLNEATTTNTLHVSLNFDPSEVLANDKLASIAATYMQKIGFGNQPFLVYRHHDSGHPHIHIVSTNIERNGNRISMHNLGRNQSEKARKEIEVDFSLVKAESKKGPEAIQLLPLNAQRISYGKRETKQSISNVLMVVINQYKYTSLPELNAILKLYNVTADRGSEESRMFQQKGLTYRVLDEGGNKIGTPIKASAFFMRPTLSNLEKKFVENETLRAPFRKRLQTNIGWILNKEPGSLESFVRELEKENISAILRKGKDGVIYGITYVDHKTKSVFNGSDLGKEYSAKAILEKCSGRNQLKPEDLNDRFLKAERIPLLQKKHQGSQQAVQEKAGNLLESLTTPSNFIDYVPQQLLKKKKRKKKRLSI